MLVESVFAPNRISLISSDSRSELFIGTMAALGRPVFPGQPAMAIAQERLDSSNRCDPWRALRWIAILVDKGLIIRESHPRRVLLRLIAACEASVARSPSASYDACNPCDPCEPIMRKWLTCPTFSHSATASPSGRAR